ncbi:MAG TPA: uroporphyrinogen-III synthase [Albitalea sp.]|nr:uroporphyrinogen-III synthase [Albitalea sp.]
MRVIVTRPAVQAAAWVQSLAQRGIDAVALPLIDIVAPDDTEAVREAWHGLGQQQLVVFVSPNAAEQFFALRPESGHGAWPAGVLAASVGPGTSECLKRHEVPPACIVEPAADSAQFDSEALWHELARRRAWQGAAVLIVRGDGGRDWLADTLRAQGASVRFVAAYRRAAARFEGESLALVQAAIAQPAEHLWFFSSSEAIDHLAQAWPDVSWAGACAMATHPRIAQRARDCGFGVIRETRPTLDAVVACIQSFAS